MIWKQKRRFAAVASGGVVTPPPEAAKRLETHPLKYADAPYRYDG
jgi:hypothetical protein